MEIRVIEITDKNIKKIRRACRKWRFRKTGATLWDIVEYSKLDKETVEATLDWMLRDGDVIRTRTMNGFGYYDEPRYHA